MINILKRFSAGILTACLTTLAINGSVVAASAISHFNRPFAIAVARDRV